MAFHDMSSIWIRLYVPLNKFITLRPKVFFRCCAMWSCWTCKHCNLSHGLPPQNYKFFSYFYYTPIIRVCTIFNQQQLNQNCNKKGYELISKVHTHIIYFIYLVSLVGIIHILLLVYSSLLRIIFLIHRNHMQVAYHILMLQ